MNAKFDDDVRALFTGASAIIGSPGTGKTSFLRAALARASMLKIIAEKGPIQRYLYLDPHDNVPIPKNNYMFKLPTDYIEHKDMLLELHKKVNNSVFILDDTRQVLPENSEPRFNRWFIRRRHKNNPIVLVYHSAMQLHKSFAPYLTNVFIFKHNEPAINIASRFHPTKISPELWMELDKQPVGTYTRIRLL